MLKTNQNLISLIESKDYKLIFRYHRGASFFQRPQRDYIFELHRCIKDHSKLIYKEWEPAMRDTEGDIESYKECDTEFYKLMIKWRNDVKMGTVVRYTPKIMELIKEFPPPETLIKVDILDGCMQDLMIHKGKKKIKYDWMMLDESQERFEKRIRQIGYIAKGEGTRKREP